LTDKPTNVFGVVLDPKDFPEQDEVDMDKFAQADEILHVDFGEPLYKEHGPTD